MNVNVNGSYFCAREAAKDMMRREAPGSIIMIGPLPSLRTRFQKADPLVQ